MKMIMVLIPIAIIVLVVLIADRTEKSTNKLDTRRYDDEVNEMGKRQMEDIDNGITLLATLGNDANPFESDKDVDSFINAINNSSVQKKILSLKGQNYYG